MDRPQPLPRECEIEIMILDELRLALRASSSSSSSSSPTAHQSHRHHYRLFRAHERQPLVWLGAELLRRSAVALWDAIVSIPRDYHNHHLQHPDAENLAYVGSGYFGRENVDDLPPSNHSDPGLLWFAVPKGRTTHARKRVRNQTWRYYPFKPLAYECQLCGRIKDKHQFCKKCLVDPVASGMATAARAPRPSLKAVLESIEDPTTARTTSNKAADAKRGEAGGGKGKNKERKKKSK